MGGASSKRKQTSTVQPVSVQVPAHTSTSVQPAHSPAQQESSPPSITHNSPTPSRPPTSFRTPLNISIDTVVAQDLNQGLNKNLSTDILITPGREESMYSKVAYTPQGEQARTYKYYCPLCMSFCMDIFKSKCCNNYTCGECCTDFLNKRDQTIHTMNDVLVNAPYKNTACPHCNTLNFHPTLVTKTDTVRDYSFNPAPKPASTASNSNTALLSPLKIGDSFEVMKSKMEKLHTSPGTISEEIESPMKTLFPNSARGTPRGIAIKQPPAISSHGDGVVGSGSGSGSGSGGGSGGGSGSGSDLELHREVASSFVGEVVSSSSRVLFGTHDESRNNINSDINFGVSEVAAEFVHNIFNPQAGICAGRRNSDRRKVLPFNLSGDDAFGDIVNIDGCSRSRGGEEEEHNPLPDGRGLLAGQ